MKKYSCVLFDLDHTLWDYDSNCAEALRDLHGEYKLRERSNHSFEMFLNAFITINTELWDQFDRGEIHRDVIRYERFHRILLEVGIDDYFLSLELSKQYVLQSPRKKNLVPNALEILDYLSLKYPLTIITNGFADIQATKLSSSGITKYFDLVVTSEKVGHKKPAKEIFEYALRHRKADPSEAIMIGDNLLTDIQGAKNAGVDDVFFNPSKKTHSNEVFMEITDLAELKSVL